MYRHKNPFLLTFCLIAFASTVYGQIKPSKTGKIKTAISTKTSTKTSNTTVSTSANVSDTEVSGGLKEALTNGVSKAVKSLGAENGFLNNEKVRIPLPKSLQTIEKGLKLAGQSKKVDEFNATMNRAAEKAVSEALPIFKDSLKQLTLTDARNILSGQEDAATQFFRRTSEEKLREKFLPIVKAKTDSTGVTAQYKGLIGQAGFLTKLGGKNGGDNNLDLDAYITSKALDGLFLLVAEEEKNIRKNPLKQTSTLLQKVFGIGKSSK
ncbi:MAG: DUF4197 domain-containing protein [Pyrinomonadaceae bacterium]|nr:DUF4197 domain-containing protein [Pyrinomonadaceae bacterium]